jgi:hypothetical protein
MHMQLKLLILSLLIAPVAMAQSLSNVPTRFAAYVSSDGSGNPGTWQPLTGTGGTSIQFVPQPIAIYYSTDGTGNPGTWAAWNGSSSSGGAVSSVFGRTGAVVATTGDYTAAQVTHALDLSSVAAQTMSGNLIMASGQSLNTGIIRDSAGNAAVALLGARWTYAASGALSLPTALWTGSPIATGGTGTTTFPMVFMQPTGATASSTWNTAGTFSGVNAPTGFAGNFFDYQLAGAARLSLSAGGTLNILTANAVNYHTVTNCSSAASPAVCGAAAAGSVAVAAGTNPTLVVDTTAVTANSQILLTEDESLGTKLSVTCQTAVLPTSTVITARTAAASFTIQANGTFTTNPVCYSYMIVN